MSPITRTHYLAMAKLIRNAKMAETSRLELARNFVEFITQCTPCFDKKRFMEVATRGKADNLST